MLVNRRVKELAAFVSGDNTSLALKKIYISKEECVATDGHALVIAPNNNTKLTDADYPSTETITDITAPVLLDTETIIKAVNNLPKRPALPILNTVQIGADSAGKTVVNSGLPPVKFIAETSDDVYPKYPDVIPDYATKQPLRFAVDAKYLKQVCELAVRHGDKYTRKIVFEVPTVTDAVKTNDEGELVRDANGAFVYESVPATELRSALKFVIKNEGEAVFSGLIMPLRITDED
jgi:hypothetical protein